MADAVFLVAPGNCQHPPSWRTACAFYNDAMVVCLLCGLAERVKTRV